MIEKIKEWIIGLFDEKVKEWLKEAYDCGYKIGSEDATRRCHELYMIGRYHGYESAQAEVGEIDLEFDDDVTRVLEGESA